MSARQCIQDQVIQVQPSISLTNEHVALDAVGVARLHQPTASLVSPATNVLTDLGDGKITDYNTDEPG
jgi:hypothetical protein